MDFHEIEKQTKLSQDCDPGDAASQPAPACLRDFFENVSDAAEFCQRRGSYMLRLLPTYFTGPDKLISDDFALTLHAIQPLNNIPEVDAFLETPETFKAFWVKLLTTIDNSIEEGGASPRPTEHIWSEIHAWVKKGCCDESNSQIAVADQSNHQANAATEAAAGVDRDGDGDHHGDTDGDAAGDAGDSGLKVSCCCLGFSDS